MIFVFGLIGLIGGFVCYLPIFLCIPAWIIGHRARQEIQENPTAYSNAGMVTAGWILGIIGTCLLILGAVVLFIVLIAVASSG